MLKLAVKLNQIVVHKFKLPVSAKIIGKVQGEAGPFAFTGSCIPNMARTVSQSRCVKRDFQLIKVPSAMVWLNRIIIFQKVDDQFTLPTFWTDAILRVRVEQQGGWTKLCWVHKQLKEKIEPTQFWKRLLNQIKATPRAYICGDVPESAGRLRQRKVFENWLGKKLYQKGLEELLALPKFCKAKLRRVKSKKLGG